MLPFREPFNTSEIYADPRLMTVLGDFFNQEQFKMELMTVITSPPGSASFSDCRPPLNGRISEATPYYSRSMARFKSVFEQANRAKHPDFLCIYAALPQVRSPLAPTARIPCLRA